MPSDAIPFLLGYAVTSFLLTAIFVRLNEQSRLAQKIRCHFYWFPIIPLILLSREFSRFVTRGLRALLDLLRYCFERLSGKKTYRRQRIDRYYRD